MPTVSPVRIDEKALQNAVLCGMAIPGALTLMLVLKSGPALLGLFSSLYGLIYWGTMYRNRPRIAETPRSNQMLPSQREVQFHALSGLFLLVSWVTLGISALYRLPLDAFVLSTLIIALPALLLTMGCWTAVLQSSQKFNLRYLAAKSKIDATNALSDHETASAGTTTGSHYVTANSHWWTDTQAREEAKVTARR